MLSPPPSTESTATPAAQTQIDWAVANYFLYREARSLLSVMGTNDGGYYIDNPALDVNLGSPAAAPFETASGVWERTYSAGLVLVNPSSTATSAVTLPAGVWIDTHGATYSGQISMSPNSGVLLMPN